MMDWTTHPGMNNLDPLKREIIRTAAKQVQGGWIQNDMERKICSNDVT